MPTGKFEFFCGLEQLLIVIVGRKQLLIVTVTIKLIVN